MAVSVSTKRYTTLVVFIITLMLLTDLNESDAESNILEEVNQKVKDTVSAIGGNLTQKVPNLGITDSVKSTGSKVKEKVTDVVTNLKGTDIAQKVKEGKDTVAQFASNWTQKVVQSPTINKTVQDMIEKTRSGLGDAVDTVVDTFDKLRGSKKPEDLQTRMEQTKNKFDSLGFSERIGKMDDSDGKLELEYNLEDLNQKMQKADSHKDVDAMRLMMDEMEWKLQYKINTTQNKCSKMCHRKDGYKTDWKGCPGQILFKKCPNGSRGNVTWSCNHQGQMDTERPNYKHCESDWLGNIRQEINQVTRLDSSGLSISKAGSILDSIKSNTGVTRDANGKLNVFGKDIREILRMTKTVSNSVNKQSGESLVGVTKKAVGIETAILSNPEPWKEIDDDERHKTATELLKSIESTVFSSVRRSRALPSGSSSSPQVFDDEFMVTLGNVPSNEDIVTYPTPSSASKVQSCVRYRVNKNSGQGTSFVGMTIDSKTLEGILPFMDSWDEDHKEKRMKRMNSHLVSFTLSDQHDELSNPSSSHGRKESVEIVLHHETPAWGNSAYKLKRRLHKSEERKAVLGQGVCSFWDDKKLELSIAGCVKVASKSDAYKTTCECDHLTAFAVLTDFHDYVGKDLGLQVLTWVLCTLSSICLIAAIISFMLMRQQRTDQHKITLHLCFSLLAGNILLIIVEKDHFHMSNAVCSAFGIITHYVWLCVFGWMAVEGFHIYQLVVNVFDTATNRLRIYSAFAYGVPALIVATTCVIGFLKEDQSIYVGNMYCWLCGAYVWSFVVPAAVVVFNNIGIFAMAIRVAAKQNSKRATVESSTESERIARQRKMNKKLLHGSGSLATILGVTWVIGFFAMVDAPGFPFLPYLFTILNASQGIFIFIFHCILNKKVWTVVTQRLESSRSSSSGRRTSWLSFSRESSFSSGRKRGKYSVTKEDIDSTPREMSQDLLSSPSSFDNRTPARQTSL